MNNTKRIFLWSGPRNISTTLMYSFAQRKDIRVFDEPLYAHYLTSTNAKEYHPDAELIIRSMECNGQLVVDEMLKNNSSEVGTMSYKNVIATLFITSLVAACGDADAPQTSVTPQVGDASASVAAVDTQRIMNAAQEPEMWLSYGGSYDETRHSSLASINGDTIQDLGVDWVYEMDKPRGAEATPIVVDGVMYVTGSWSVVYAIDARTGKELWTYDPEVSGEDAAKGCCDVVNRGVAVHNGKVFVGVFDGRLEALDAASGEVL